MAAIVNSDMDVPVISALGNNDWSSIKRSGFTYTDIGIPETDEIFRDPCGFALGQRLQIGETFRGKSIDLTDYAADKFAKNPKFAKMKEYLESYVKMKAGDTATSVLGGTGTAAVSIYSPLDFERNVWDMSLQWTPFYTGILPKETWDSTLIPFDRITAKGAGSMVGEDAAGTPVEDTELQTYYNMRYYQIKKRITWQAEATLKPFSIVGGGMTGTGIGSSESRQIVAAPDPRRKQLISGNRALDELLEAQILKGNGTAPNMTGILYQIHTAAAGAGYVTPNKIDKGGTTEFALNDISHIVKKAWDKGGRTSLILSTSGVYTAMEEALGDRIYNMPQVTMPWGMTYIAFNTRAGPVPIIPSQFADLNDKECLWALDMNLGNIVSKVLRPRTYYEVPSPTPAREFMLYGGEAPIVHNPYLCAYAYNYSIPTY